MINHRLLMLKIVYIKDLVTEHPITQITSINILTNIQLMFFNNCKQIQHTTRRTHLIILLMVLLLISIVPLTLMVLTM